MERLTGGHSVLEALRAKRRRVHRLLVAAEGPAPALRHEAEALARDQEVPIEVLPRDEDPGRTQGLLLEADRIPELGLEGLIEVADAPGAWLLALDGVEDPQNLGALARVADAAGCAGLVLTRRHAPPLSPAVSRASAGAIEHLPVARVPNLKRALAELGEHGFWSIGADPEGESTLYDLPDKTWEGRLVFVMGAEGQGMRQNVRESVDHRVQIPMSGKVASLNVATAAAVLLFESARRRHSRERA